MAVRIPVTAHPEYAAIGTHAVEHRVGPRPRQCSGSTRGPSTWLLLGLVAALCMVATLGPARQYILALLHASMAVKAAIVVVSLVVAFISSSGVVYQSLTPLPGLGLQLCTARGLRIGGFTIPLSAARTFLALDDIDTVVIHEGLRRWNIKFYLAVLLSSGKVVVVFDDVNPHHAVLEEVYHSTREALWDEYDDDTDTGSDSAAAGTFC